MWYEGLFEQMESMEDSAQAEKMAAYMKNMFSFLGIPKPALKSLIKPYLKSSRKAEIDWDFVAQCWEKPYREAQYTAVEYLLVHQAQLQAKDLPRLQGLITEKSWWDTVDNLDGLIGTLVWKEPALKADMRAWAASENMWLRRAAIDHQQRLKEKTDTALLEEIVLMNLGSDAFFINKAIGWSLREYGKSDPAWLEDFLARHGDALAPLSLREAKKRL